MTIETVLAWSIVRSLLVATVALPISFAMARICGSQKLPRRLRQLAIVVAVLPLLVPDLLTGFTYRLTSAKLLHSVAATEGLYAILLLFRIVALQVAVRLILPGTAVGAEALHTWKLTSHNQPNWRWNWFRMQVIGPRRTPLIAWLGSCLLCFQDFETAALLQINRHPIAWTVWLFDAHAAGEPLTNSLQYVLKPLVFQLLILLPALLLLVGQGRRGGGAESADVVAVGRDAGSKVRRTPLWNGVAVVFGVLSLSIVLLWPVVVNIGQLWEGFRSLVEQNNLWPRILQISFSLLTCSMAAVLAVWVCWVLKESAGRLATVLVLLPGLCGSLVTGLVLLAAFQLPMLNKAYDTWLPMLLGQTLILLPRAWLLVVLLQVMSDTMAKHSAELLLPSGRPNVSATCKQILWQMGRRRWLVAVTILTHWSFWDVSIVSMLRPVRFEPIVTRLYNEMHYGRTATLIAITMLSMLIPLAVALGVGFVLKQFPQQKPRTNG